MPELPEPKDRIHPARRACDAQVLRHHPAEQPYVELEVTSNFTFLTGASHPEEMVERAAVLGHRAAAIADTNTLAGVVRAHVAAKAAGIHLLIGSRIILQDQPPGASCLLFAMNRAGYANLSRLLTIGKRRAGKGECFLHIHDIADHAVDLIAVFIPPRVIDQPVIELAEGLADIFSSDDRLSIAARSLYSHDDHDSIALIHAFCTHVGVPMVATNDVHYHDPSRRLLQDVLTCIRHGCSIHDAGLSLFANGERYIKSPTEMADIFRDMPDALERTLAIASRCSFSLDELRYEYPDEICPAACSPQEYLVHLTWQGAQYRYPRGIPERVRNMLERELILIHELQYAPYFLTVHDLVRFARSHGILCQGRGAAANSAVCYCLEVTSVDPDQVNLLVERFISHARNEPPDIDIDFEHERREEVIQYIYHKYGRDRAALTAEVISYRGRSAVRDVGKALGLSLDCVDQLAKARDWWDSGDLVPARLRELGLDPNDPTLLNLARLVHEIRGFPRHLSQHVGGFVITRRPLCELVPIENAAMDDRTVIEWDKDDIDAMNMLKVDCLGLGMLTCIRKAFTFIDADELSRDDENNSDATQIISHHISSDSSSAVAALPQTATVRAPLSLATVPREDACVYDMLCQADAVGVFQVESRAQMAMLPRLKPRCYYDLVIEVAIVRPGPIQGNMVHPYLRRRAGEEDATYPDDKVKKVLSRTLGVPIFQEQAMELSMVAAGFSAEDADHLRRTMAAWKRKGDQLARFGEKLIAGMLHNGYDLAFAERCFEQIKGFSEYGFPESHAASFAHLVYVSAWLKCHYPAAFAAALINSQPMGFYAPAQIIRDAQAHAVTVHPIDVNHSDWDCTLEGRGQDAALRLGMRLVKGLKHDDAERLVQARSHHGAYDTIESLRHISNISIAGLQRLARADAFQSMNLDRQHALWNIQRLHDDVLPLFAEQNIVSVNETETSHHLPAISLPLQVSSDYRHTGFSLKAHPVSFLREMLDRESVIRSVDLMDETRFRTGKKVAVSGVVICRQRPGTASGIVFITLEDETGIFNLIVRPKVYERYRHAARHSVLLHVTGKVERKHNVIHIMAHRMTSLDHHMQDIVARSRDFH
ncbi:MAG: error-prone DNA polymerase [Phycisphaerales bacterium]